MLPARRSPTGSHRFQTTQWSLVSAAARPSNRAGKNALAAICESYWYPLYGYVRRSGHGPEDAADLTQEFFARLIERNDLAAVRRDSGRFRSYLLGALKHFLSNEVSKDGRLKRGRAAQHVSVDVTAAEATYRGDGAGGRTPETAFERSWALTALGRAVAELQQQWSERGRARDFEILKPTLLGAPSDYAQLAAALGLTVNATQVAVHRVRRAFREVVKRTVGETVLSPGAIEAELGDLLGALDDL
jgi:RNA polymerase sigma factor (sigma-70 family)